MQTTGELIAGPKLNGRVAKMMGVEPCDRHKSYGECGHGIFGNDYSTDIAAAWLVIEKMQTDGWDFAIESDIRANSRWWVQASKAGVQYNARGHSVPLAICRVALAAADSQHHQSANDLGSPPTP